MLLAFVGDVMLGRGVAEEIQTRNPESFWGDTLPLLRQADLVVANLECAITTYSVPCTPKVFNFKTPPSAVDVLRAAGVRLVSLANNHILDYQIPGLLETLRLLDAADIGHAGAGRDAREAALPAVVEAGGRRIGMIAYTDNERRWAAGIERPGTNYLEIDLSPSTFERVRADIEAARRAGADDLILALHWGPNMRKAPTPVFRRFARRAVELGADVVFGHSAHIFQGVEVYQGKPILYDTGDFIDDYAIDPVLRNDWSFIFLLQDGDLHLEPVRLSYAQVNRAHGEERAAILERMRTRCREFPKGIVV